jgi:hypothetical protein
MAPFVDWKERLRGIEKGLDRLSSHTKYVPVMLCAIAGAKLYALSKYRDPELS